MKRNYPIGIQTFSEIINGNCLYIDKTKQVYDLATAGKYFFLARPRRFGKSLLVSTLNSLFSGRKELFKGLWIEDKWDWTKKHPIIYIPFNILSYHNLGLNTALFDWLSQQAEELGLALEGKDAPHLFKIFIEAAYKKIGKKVVVLIDEYDKSLIDYLDNDAQFEENRRFLKSFYGIMEPSDEYLEFVLLTGVSQFSKVSIFSDLNNIRDITLDENFGDIVGISQKDLESYFEKELNTISEAKDITKEVFLENIKSWYNGYTWDLKTKMYNPFSLLLFFVNNGKFENYWFQTGTPNFLISELRKHNLYEIKKIETTANVLTSFDAQNLNVTCLLFQTGYLTLSDYDAEFGIYTLDFPNREVRHSLLQYLMESYRSNTEAVLPTVVDFYKALKKNDIDLAMKHINTVFSTIPAELWQKDNEHFYHALIHLTFVLLGAYVQSEVNSSNGRCDAILQTDEYIYALEFKLDKSAEMALQQIEDKGYLLPYSASSKPKIGIGINFSKELKRVESYLVKVY